MTAFEGGWSVLKAPFMAHHTLVPRGMQSQGRPPPTVLPRLYRGQKEGEEQGRWWTTDPRRALLHSMFGDSVHPRPGLPQLLISEGQGNPDVFTDPSYGTIWDNGRVAIDSVANLGMGFDDVQSLTGEDLLRWVRNNYEDERMKMVQGNPYLRANLKNFMLDPWEERAQLLEDLKENLRRPHSGLRGSYGALRPPEDPQMMAYAQAMGFTPEWKQAGQSFDEEMLAQLRHIALMNGVAAPTSTWAEVRQ